MTPAVRRAFHQALDLVLDALADEQRGEPKRKRLRAPLSRPLPPLPPDTTSEEIDATEKRLERAGFRKTG